jgi:ketosteroid isomerase-like protein
MKKLLIAAFSAALVYGCGNANQPVEMAVETMTSEESSKPVELGDTLLIETGKAMFRAMTEGNVGQFLAFFADDAVYGFNSGDSLAGKVAISEFWTKRRTEVIKTLTADKQIWLPLNVNQQQSVERTGKYLLTWAEVTATYFNGKSMTQWMHWTIHFNDNNQIDRMHQYFDSAPIAKASQGKM